MSDNEGKTHAAGENKFSFEESRAHGANIKVVGVGGGGSNAVDRMISARMEGIEFIVANTDVQVLQANSAATECRTMSPRASPRIVVRWIPRFQCFLSTRTRTHPHG